MVASASNTIIENCYTTGASVYDANVTNDIFLDVDVQRDTYIGGLIGNLEGNGSGDVASMAKNCYAQLNIYSNSSSSYIGGIVGCLYQETVLVENCYFNGNITNNYYGGLIVGHSESKGNTNNCFAITSNFECTYSYEMVFGTSMAAYEGYYNNLAYINNTNKSNGDADFNQVIRIGGDQTALNVTINTFYSAGLMHDAFGWETGVWGTDIYSENKGLLVLRIFYNF